MIINNTVLGSTFLKELEDEDNNNQELLEGESN
jgi:hypothetical protein